MKKGRTILSVILTGAAIVCLIAAAAIMITRYLEEQRMQQTLESLRPTSESAQISLIGSSESASIELSEAATPESSTDTQVPSTTDPSIESSMESSADSTSSAESASPTVPQEPLPERIANPYADSYLANTDMAAWLVVPGTVIDYPVMWTPRDENYYLRKDFYGNKNTAGCLILDTDSCVDPLTTNLIIHGHNMKAGTMFAALKNYEEESFWEEHKEVILYTPECQRNYEVIAVFRSQVYKKSDEVFKFYKFFEAETEEAFYDFYDNIKEMAMYDTGVTAEFGDRFITLSTCSYHVENGRLVVVAKEVEPGDYYLPLDRPED